MDCRNQKKILQIKKKQGNSRTGNIKSTATEVGECSGGHRISFCFFVFPFIFLCVCVNNVFFCLLFFFCLMLRRPTIRALMDRGARLAQSRSIPSDPVLLVVSHSFVFFLLLFRGFGFGFVGRTCSRLASAVVLRFFLSSRPMRRRRQRLEPYWTTSSEGSPFFSDSPDRITRSFVAGRDGCARGHGRGDRAAHREESPASYLAGKKKRKERNLFFFALKGKGSFLLCFFWRPPS